MFWAVPVKFVLQMIQYDPTTVDEFVTEFTPVFLLMCFPGLVQNSSMPKNPKTWSWFRDVSCTFSSSSSFEQQGPQQVLDALRFELMCENMQSVQEAFKGLEVHRDSVSVLLRCESTDSKQKVCAIWFQTSVSFNLVSNVACSLQ